ncbi:MAG: hypothetical protein RBU29_11145 [bacterium]|jgi:hypothetical protein|nr:hypothetical protein [bacterium]
MMNLAERWLQMWVAPLILGLSLLFILTASCGRNYLTASERARLNVTLTRAQEAQATFEQTLQQAQLALKIIQDAYPLIQASLEKSSTPAPDWDKKVRVWQQQVLLTSSLGKEPQLTPFYQALAETLGETIALLEAMQIYDTGR